MREACTLPILFCSVLVKHLEHCIQSGAPQYKEDIGMLQLGHQNAAVSVRRLEKSDV